MVGMVGVGIGNMGGPGRAGRAGGGLGAGWGPRWNKR
jgi:hypothetical protein